MPEATLATASISGRTRGIAAGLGSTPLWLVLLLAWVVLSAERAHAQCASAPNPIVCENALPGTTGWKLDGPISSDSGGEIQGYASATSVDTGDSIDFHVTVGTSGDLFNLEVYRMGWYDGDGGRRMTLPPGSPAQPLTGVDQPTCEVPTGVDLPPGFPAGFVPSRRCAWSISLSLTVPTDWTTGIYLARLENLTSSHQAYILFVVREDDRIGTFYYEQAVMNYQAYNRYPADAPVSFYTSNGTTNPWDKTLYFDRPHGSSLFPRNNQSPFGAQGDGSGGFFTWDFPMIQWLEQQGYDVSYATNVDLHENPERLLDFAAMISVGHDEYWTDEMATAAAHARDSGVDLAFFAGNHVFGTVDYDPGTRTITGVSKAGAPGVDPGWWDHPDYPDKKKRQALLGQANTGCCVRKPATYYNLDWIVAEPAHWVFDGTGFQLGDAVPGLLGYEPDATDPNFLAACSPDFTELSASPFDPVAAGAATNTDTTYLNSWPLDFAHSTIYQAPSGAWVFSAGSTDWPWGLRTPFATGATPSFQATTGAPETQGFSIERTATGVGQIVTDIEPATSQAVTAWQADGAGGLVSARRFPDGSEAWGLEEGYTLTADIRAESGELVTAYYATGAKRFLFRLSIDANGHLDVGLDGGPTLQDVVSNGAGAYHEHRVVYDGATETASYYFDGALRASGWVGTSSTQRGLYFGQGSTGTAGVGYFRSVSLIPATPLTPDVRIQTMTRNILDAMAQPSPAAQPILYDPAQCDPPSTAPGDSTGTPSRQGWTPSPTGSGTGTLVTDTVDGVPAPVWHANGTDGRATWDWIPSAALETWVAQNGWQIKSRVRVLSGTFVTDYYADGSGRFLPILSRQPNGDLAVQLEAGGFHVLASGNSADDYHTHAVRFNPLTQTATYSFDGVPIETWAGTTTAQRQITFGQGSTPNDGRAYYRSMTFQPAPEPGTTTALAAGIALLSGVARRRGRPRR